MIIKKVLKIFFIATVLVNQSVFAHSPLERNVADVLNSDKYIVSYTIFEELTNYKSSDYEDTKQYLQDHKDVYTFVKNGNDYLTIIDSYYKNKFVQSTGFLFKNGLSYLIVNSKKKCYDEHKLILNDDEPIVKMTGKDAIDSFNGYIWQMRYYLLPIVQFGINLREIYGDQMAENPCAEYVKDGEMVISGAEKHYVEYRTPLNYKAESISRYIFENNVLRKYIRIEKEKAVASELLWQKLFGVEKYGYGGYTIIDFKQFSRDIPIGWFKIPNNALIYEDKMPNDFY